NFRTRNEYDQDCRLTATFQENRQGFGAWTAYERTFYSYEQFADSTIKTTRIEYWRNDLNAWSINNFNREVYDAKEQLIRFYSEFDEGRAGENIYRYNELGEQVYERAGFRDRQTAQWYYWHERLVLENTPTRQLYLRRNDLDTISQQYRYTYLWEQLFDEQERVLAQNFIDSVWNGSEYEVSDRQITFEYEDYCDGLTKTQFQREGASGLTPQPRGKIVYGYLNDAECDFVLEETALEIHPNPSNHFIMISSELLYDSQTSIKVIDLRGSTVKTFTNFGRQNRLTLDLRDLKSGMYIVQLNHPESQQSQRIIKQ
ncbi:MAG: T9SS type A sorting domain-containing protein, partial [Bacteroidota bacterium]